MSKFKPVKGSKILQPVRGLTKDGQPATPRRPIRIGIAVPSRDQVKAGFAFDLARMVAFTAVQAVAKGHLELVLLNNRGTLIVNQRHELVVEALRNECDAILWLDDDMRFPPDTLFRLIAHDQPIVAANYSTRKEPVHPVAFTNVDRDNPASYRYVWTTEESTGLEPCDTVGMGVMLTHVKVFLSMKPPAFLLTWNEKGSGFEGEDIYFCLKAKEHGYTIYVDHDLSKQIAHAGEHEYSMLVDGRIWYERAEEEQQKKRELWAAAAKLRDAGIFNLEAPTNIGASLPDKGEAFEDGTDD